MLDVLFEGEPGRRRRASRARTAPCARCAPRSSSTPAARPACIQNRFRLRVWDPVLNKGAIWTYWKGAYRDTGRDEGATLVLQTPSSNGWFWYIPLHDDIVSVGVVAPFDYLFKGRGPVTSRPTTRRWRPCPAVKERVVEGATRVTGYFATKDYSYRSTEVAGDGWVLVGDAFGFLDPLYSSGVLLALQLGRAGRRRDRARASRKGDTSARPARQVGPGASTRAWTACAGWSASTTTASASASSCRKYPHLRGTVTDLLIGDLFTDRVDKVWAPMESLYEPGKSKIPRWNETNGDAAPGTERPTSSSCPRDEGPSRLRARSKICE